MFDINRNMTFCISQGAHNQAQRELIRHLFIEKYVVFVKLI